jgi:hypothetical protein
VRKGHRNAPNAGTKQKLADVLLQHRVALRQRTA